MSQQMPKLTPSGANALQILCGAFIAAFGYGVGAMVFGHFLATPIRQMLGS